MRSNTMFEVRGIIAQFFLIRYSFSSFYFILPFCKRDIRALCRIAPAMLYQRSSLKEVFLLIAHIDFEAVGSLVRAFRHQAGMTQEQLAEKIGMSTNFIGNIERGVSTPSATTLFRIALALNVTMQDLLNEHTLIWREEADPLTLRSPSTVFCNTLSDWLLKSEEEAFADNPAVPANPIDLSSIGFLMLDEDFPTDSSSR